MKKPTGRGTREQVIREVTNDLLKAKFTTDVGQKARVERSEMSSPEMEDLRGVISEVGRNLCEVGAVPRGMEYRGSLSIHVFASSALKTAAFATVSNLGTMTFDLADAALRELTGSTMEQYGKRRQRLRSGF